MNYFAFILSIGIALCWAISPLLQKVVLKSIPMPTLLMLTTAFYSFGVFLFIYFNRHEVGASIPKIDMKLIGIAFIIGIICGLIPNIVFMKLLKNNRSHIVTALTYSSPLFTTLFAYMFLHEQITLKSVIGVCSIVFGIIMIGMDTIGVAEPFHVVANE